MDQEETDKLWQRAYHIAAAGDMKMSSTDELKDEYEMRELIHQHEEAKSAETIIKRGLTELHSDRQTYLAALDRIAELSTKKKSNRDFWDNIMQIIQEESEDFQLDAPEKSQNLPL